MHKSFHQSAKNTDEELKKKKKSKNASAMLFALHANTALHDERFALAVLLNQTLNFLLS